MLKLVKKSNTKLVSRTCKVLSVKWWIGSIFIYKSTEYLKLNTDPNRKDSRIQVAFPKV
jgi:hypothetical protein